MRAPIRISHRTKLFLLASLTAFVFVSRLVFQANDVQAVACAIGSAAQNGITVNPSHGSVFYIDTGVTPVLDAGYIGYRVTNGTGSAQDDLWVQVSDFTGSTLTLANALDTRHQLPTLANGSTGTSYFMLKATGATTSAQGHTLSVYDGRPDLSGSSLLYECDFSFTKVQETIKAAANKVADNGLTSSAAIEVSDSSPELGQLITVTVEGQTGQIGQGSSPDFDIIWLTPAAISTWPTRALRLEDVSITFDGNGNWTTAGDQVTYNDLLLITDADGLTNVDNSEYRVSYSFRVIGRPNATVTAVPVAQIASGTQVKHSDTGATGGTLNLSFSSLAINAALTKSVTSTTGLTVEDCTGACAVPGESGSGETYVAVPYRLTASSTTATTLVVDEFVDQVPAGPIFKTGSATVTDIGRTGVAIDDPVTITTDADPKPLHFVGPFNLNSGTNASVDYEMWVPVGSFANTAYAKIGDYLIGATTSAMSRITVTSTGTSTVGVVSDTVDFSVSAVTDPATSITSSGATINGTVDPNGAVILTGQFQYGTSPTLVGATTVTATTPVSGTLNGLTDPTAVSVALTGLSSGTTYYYRVTAGSAQGSILSFTTAAVLAPPTVATTAASDVLATSATLNGTINPNLTSITGIQFIYGTDSGLSSGTTTVTLDDGTGLAALTAGGSSTQPFAQNVTGLTSGSTYYFKIRACTSALSGTYPNVTCSSYVEGSILSFTPGTTARTLSIDSGSYVASYTMTDTPPTITSTPSAGTGTKTYSSSTTGVCTIDSSTGVVTFVSAGTCTIGASIATDGTYSSAVASDISFSISLVSRTYAIDGGSYAASYSMTDTPPTITSTASAGAGTKSYTSVTPSVCTIDGSTGVVTFVAAGTCTIDADIASDGTYVGADASDVSFTVSLASRTHAIDSGSYAASYQLTDTPPTITSTPSAGAGTKSYSSSTTSVCTINSSSGVVSFVAVGTCTIGSSIASDGAYATANASDISFLIGLTSRTLTIDVASYAASYELSDTPPTITSTASAGAGTKSYTSVTPSVCTIDGSTGVVTFVAAGTCTIDADIASDGTYGAADALDITFTVTSGGGDEAPGGPVMGSPAGASVTINAGDTCAATRSVTLTLSASNANEVLISNNSLLTGSSWAAFSSPAQTAWTLPTGDGTKTVYVLFRNGALTSSVASDTIVLDVADACGTDDDDSDDSSGGSESSTSDADDEPSTSSDQAATGGEDEESESSEDGTTNVGPDFSGISYDVFIVNPDGTQRRTSDLYYVRRTAAGEDTDLIRFEDKGADFDYDDVVLRVDRSDWSRLTLTAVSVDAGWRHNVRVAIYNRGALVGNVLVWADSHLGVGQYAVIDADAEGAFRGLGPIVDPLDPDVTPYLNPDGILPPLPMYLLESPLEEGQACEVSCGDVTYDVYIVNPDGTERHTGSRYVRQVEVAPGQVLYAFEDSGKDFDYNDVMILADVADCQDVKMTMTDLSAGWHHRVVLSVAYKGIRRFESMVWADTHAAVGETTGVAVGNRPEMCVEPVVEEVSVSAAACVLEEPIGAPISLGDRGDVVRGVQEVLQCLGFFPNDATASGYFGPLTESAVTAFQAANGLLPTTGAVGPRTRALLNALTP